MRLSEARALGAGRAHLDRLVEGGWLAEEEVRVDRSPLEDMVFAAVPALQLSDGQNEVAEAIWAAGGEHLLHGVTGSGKTEVYLDLVRRTLGAGRGAIVLVPEISLTPQAVRRFGERFGETLAVFHSGLGDGELYDQWYRVANGEARVVLGSRSALFAPVRDLGLVVLDEEHEPSYKQSEPQPRYHARETARKLAELTGATLVLGTATPDIASFHRTTTGDSSLHRLRDRLVPDGLGGTTKGESPRIRVVDMREELKAGNRGIFSVPLVRGVERALAEGMQAILFVNRRGAARFMLCRDCSYVPECPNCRIAMGLDTRDAIVPRVTCHHCGRSRKLEERCPRCGSQRFRPFGVGTQRIEYEARKVFAGARVARWDSDTSSRKGAHEQMVARLQAGEIDIVVGTQLLAKGLDLPKMAVVGVVDADVGLHLPTYVAQERTFQLISQVAGRAGRRAQRGFAYVQTYEPENAAIRAAASGDYETFYERECEHRRRAGYPPFGRLARLTFRHSNIEHGLEEASRVATELRAHRDAAGRADPDILGPAAAYIRRVRGEYRWGILVRGRAPAELVEKVRLGPRWTVDIDPVNLL
jgi:primosomal protein N' (replication factor Y)